MDLDKKNQIIFEHLLEYARFPVKELAKILHVTKASVVNRIDNLEEKGYISRYDAIINWQKLKLIKKVYHIKVNDKEKEYLITKIKEKSPVFSIIKLSGLYNLQVWCFFKTKNMQIEFEKDMKKYTPISLDIKKLEILSSSFFNHALKLYPPKIKEATINLKDIDIKIMKYMAQGNGRTSFLEISKKLNIHYDSLHYHAKNLIKAGYFSRIIAQPGENNFTLKTSVLLLKFAKKETAKEFYEKVSKQNKIRSIALTKDNKILIHFYSQNFTEYQNKLNEISSIINRDLIKDIKIMHWDKVILNNRYPLEFLIE